VKAQAAGGRWAECLGRNELQFIPLPATWLNGRRWEDEVAGPPAWTGAVKPDGPPAGDPYKPTTPLQRLVCVYKILKGLKLDDRAWDAAQWGATAPEAQRLLAAFDGRDQAAAEWLEAWAAPKGAAGKPWALAWATKDAWEGKAARAAAPPDDAPRLRRHAASGAELARDFLAAADHFAPEETHG
jgi:hypothetical protein